MYRNVVDNFLKFSSPQESYWDAVEASSESPRFPLSAHEEPAIVDKIREIVKKRKFYGQADHKG